MLTATTCIADYVSSDFAIGRRLAFAIVCSYLEQHQMERMSLTRFPPGSLVAFFYEPYHRILYNLLKKTIFLQSHTYEML